VEHAVRDGTNASLYGLILQVPDFGELELFRNGHLELRMQNSITVAERDGLTYLGERAIIEYTVSMFRLAREIYKHIQLSEPVILSLTLLNIKDANLKRRPDTNPDLTEFLLGLTQTSNSILSPSILLNIETTQQNAY
jgi:hypothetical protein